MRKYGMWKWKKKEIASLKRWVEGGGQRREIGTFETREQKLVDQMRVIRTNEWLT